jgi:hypothetical protein
LRSNFASGKLFVIDQEGQMSDPLRIIAPTPLPVPRAANSNHPIAHRDDPVPVPGPARVSLLAFAAQSLLEIAVVGLVLADVLVLAIGGGR